MGRKAAEPEVAPQVMAGLKPWLVSELKTPCVYYDSDFLPADTATQLYNELSSTLQWETNSNINRMTALHGEIADAGPEEYHYKDAPSLKLLPWTEALQRVKAAAETWYREKTGVDVSFNVCLCNYYQDGQQRIGWHTDREEIGRTTPIASVSLGAERKFLLRGMAERTDTAELTLASGSLTVMENLCQHRYVHCVPREQSVHGGRINLTFRCKHGVTAGEERHSAGQTSGGGPGGAADQQQGRADAAQLQLHPFNAPPRQSAAHDMPEHVRTQREVAISGEEVSAAAAASTLMPSACLTAALAAFGAGSCVAGSSCSRSLRAGQLAAISVAAVVAVPLGVGAALGLEQLWRSIQHAERVDTVASATPAVSNTPKQGPESGENPTLLEEDMLDDGGDGRCERGNL